MFANFCFAFVHNLNTFSHILASLRQLLLVNKWPQNNSWERGRVQEMPHSTPDTARNCVAQAPNSCIGDCDSCCCCCCCLRVVLVVCCLLVAHCHCSTMSAACPQCRNSTLKFPARALRNAQLHSIPSAKRIHGEHK